MMNSLATDSECCNCASEYDDSAYRCEDRKLVFTKRERKVLAKIREASLRARALKDKALYAPDVEAKDDAERTLEHLRTLRSELESERIDAAEERMRLLGHA